jgi:hypothetical protein
MGLDIRAYSKLRLVRSVGSTANSFANDDDVNGLALIMPSFDQRCSDGLVDGLYEFGESVHFRAGSYSSYNEWRAMLCKAALKVSPQTVWMSPRTFAGRPFAKLIHFSDCEGVIGPRTSVLLSKDFAGHSEEFGKKFAGDDTRFMARYDEWARAFGLAADGGAVVFC